MIKKEVDIFYFFAKEPWRWFSFLELKKVSRKKSRSYLDRTLKNLLKEDIIKLEKVGKSIIYSLNLVSTKSVIFAGFILEYSGWKRKDIPYKNIQKIIDSIPYKDNILLITGSYAGKKQTKTSDLDIVILIENDLEPKKVYAQLKLICELNIPQIHLYVFRYKEFVEMICNNEANYGKEILKNNLIIKGGQSFVLLIKEALEHGFNAKKLY